MPEDPAHIGWLTFIDPKRNHRTSLPVSHGPTRTQVLAGEGSEEDRTINVWHIDIQGDVVITSPSVHAPGEWHSPEPDPMAVGTQRGA